MRLAAVRRDASIVEEIAVVRMEHRPVADRRRQVCGHAAARGHVERDRPDATVVVEADVVVDAEIVTLAGHDHVVVAVEPELGRTSGPACDEGGDGRHEGGLAFLAAEPSAHAADLDRNRMVRHGEDLGDVVLDLARVLGRGIDEHVAVLARNRHGDHAFEVEVILAANPDSPLDAIRAVGEQLVGIAESHLVFGEDEAFAFHRRIDVENGFKVLVDDFRLRRGPSGGLDVLGRHREEGLADILHQPLRKDRVVAHDRTAVVYSGNVRGTDHAHRSRIGPDLGEVHVDDAGMGPLAHRDIDVQEAGRFGNVVDIHRFAADMLGSAVMAPGLAHRAADGGSVAVSGGHHRLPTFPTRGVRAPCLRIRARI